jgi:cell wall-associated NlpC family hydrolase
MVETRKGSDTATHLTAAESLISPPTIHSPQECAMNTPPSKTHRARAVATIAAFIALVGVTAAPSASAAAGTDTLSGASNESLRAGQAGQDTLWSPRHTYRLVMQTDGNLVEYGPSGALWSSNTAVSGANRAVMQSDGNLVLYTPSGLPVFATGTSGPSPRLVVQDDGNVVEYAGPAVWASQNRSERAIQWFYDHQGQTGYEGLCEAAVEAGFGNYFRYPTAIADWNSRAKRTPYNSAERGALVFYNTSANGHVAISLGNGRVISTSVNHRIGVAPIGYFQNPLGWAWAP